MSLPHLHYAMSPTAELMVFASTNRFVLLEQQQETRCYESTCMVDIKQLEIKGSITAALILPIVDPRSHVTKIV